jgi:glycosyltransferase involved in cell wall biosynthesis
VPTDGPNPSERVLRLAVDATALLGQPTGVGTFTREVLGRFATTEGLDAVAFSVSWRGRGELAEVLPDGVSAVGRPMAARPLRAAWRRVDWPPIEAWTGPVDVVHGPNFVVPPARRAARVLTVHDLTAVRFPELCTDDVRAWPALARRAVAEGAWVHAVSSFVGDEARDHLGVPDDRLVVVPNGVSPVPEVPAGTGRARVAHDRFVLALGTLEPRKDLPTLVRAFDAVAADDPELALVLAGADGWGAEAVHAAVEAARHGDRIVCTGWVDPYARAALLRDAAVLAFPSRYEGFGLPPLEAMSVGVPVVATAVGAVPEVVGDAAALVPPEDPDALARALTEVLAGADDLIARGRERAAGFSWDHCAEGLVALFQRAAAAS